ncbi:MAG: hypothetical protein A3E25_13730 [Burkholderiales bacterium RIFCSPHIGHO2_12_FULL_69_20]|nr:MAG: hypothetical protein A3E25_13730 [Burkholderiales bacterium RIFCSPHIGHO2_12_FULL_69_20]
MKPHRLLGLLAWAAAAALGTPATAQDLSWSGFGTLGYAQSNRDHTYQRYIDHSGGLERDTVFGVQADWRLGPQWSATLQLKAAPSLKSDSRWDVVPAWAFVAWRPTNDWLLRVGRVRAPLYLYSESMDVGQTHDMARLPTELYSVAPTTDIDGAYVTRSWALGETGDRELSLDAYHGAANTTARFWTRDGLPPVEPAGAQFKDVHVELTGLALTLRQPDLVLRTSVHQARTRQRNGQALPVRFPFVPVGPGIGYYQVSNSLPGPGVPTVGTIGNTIFSLGGEATLGGGWRVAGEFVRNQQHDTELASDTKARYIAVFRQMGKFTPYLSVARLDSPARSFDWYQRLTNPSLPGFIPGAAQLNAAQRMAGESIWLADQHSVAVGSSYALSPSMKLKGEWMRSRIGQMSRLVDTPPGSATVSQQSIDVWSINLNFAF